jgi:hypothetical protein
MKYSEEAALSLQRKYKLPDATLRTWKYRDSIPDQYAEKQITMQQAFVKIITPEYQQKYLASLSENQRQELERYLSETLVPKSITYKQTQQRLIDFRRWVRSKFS